MTKTSRQVEELLSQQADQLLAESVAGPGAALKLPEPDRAGLTGEEERALGGLMQLARRVQKVLVEVEPRPAFVADLKSRLVAQRRAERQPAAAEGRGKLWLAGLAGAVSLAGLGFLSYRVARVGAGWISSAAASRSARPALPKA